MPGPRVLGNGCGVRVVSDTSTQNTACRRVLCSVLRCGQKNEALVFSCWRNPERSEGRSRRIDVNVNSTGILGIYGQEAEIDGK